MRSCLALMSLLLLTITPAPVVSAAEVKVASRITSVTVFPRGAEVTRAGNVALAAGAHTVIFEILPGEVVRGSVRIAGDVNGKLEIGSVDVRRIKVREAEKGTLDDATRKAIEKRIEAFQDERAGLDGAIRAAETERALIQNLTALPSRPVSRDAGGGKRTPEEWGAILNLIGARMSGVQKTILDVHVKQRGIDRKIVDLRKQLETKPPRRRARTEVRVHLAAASALKGTLTLRYQVTSASWSPLYEARLSTGGKSEAPSLSLVRRASIVQRTGEDWREVALTLSTTRPRQGTAAPDIGTQTVVFRSPPPAPMPTVGFVRRRMVLGKQAAKAYGGRAMQPAAEEAARMSAALKRRPVSARQASVRHAPFQALYRIPGRQTVRGVKGAKIVQIDSIALVPAIEVRTVPRRLAKAYLYAVFTLAKDVALLPGRVALFRDGVFVGRGRLPVLSAGEKHALGFGIDDRLRVKYATLKRERGKTGIITSSSTDERRFLITITNLHRRKITVEVRDRIPVSEEEEIEVTPLAFTPTPAKRNVDGKRGVFAWTLVLAPGKSQEVRVGYRITWPKGKKITFRPPEPPYPIMK